VSQWVRRAGGSDCKNDTNQTPGQVIQHHWTSKCSSMDWFGDITTNNAACSAHCDKIAQSLEPKWNKPKLCQLASKWQMWSRWLGAQTLGTCVRMHFTMFWKKHSAGSRQIHRFCFGHIVSATAKFYKTNHLQVCNVLRKATGVVIFHNGSLFQWKVWTKRNQVMHATRCSTWSCIRLLKACIMVICQNSKMFGSC